MCGCSEPCEGVSRACCSRDDCKCEHSMTRDAKEPQNGAEGAEKGCRGRDKAVSHVRGGAAALHVSPAYRI